MVFSNCGVTLRLCNSVAGRLWEGVTMLLWCLTVLPNGVTVLLDANYLHLQNATRQKFFKKMLEIAKYSGTISLYRCSTRCSRSALPLGVKH